MLDETGERYLPWWQEAVISYEHLHRYAYATQFVADKKVLDLASGEGYGSYLLAETADSVVGIDIDGKAIKHAANKYLRSNLRFEIGSITDVPIRGQNLFQVITCFEAIEHIDDHDKLLREVKRLLTRDGVFIVSTPNKWAYTDEPTHRNPFHVHELYFQEFKALLEAYFKQVRFLGQRVYGSSTIWPLFRRENSRLVEYVIDKNPTEYVFVEKDKRVPIYFIAIASDAPNVIEESASVLIDRSNQLIKQREAEIASLASAHDALEKTVSSQQHAAIQKDEQIRRLTQECDSLAQQVQALQRAIEAKEEQITAYLTDKQRADFRLNELREQVENQSRALSQQDKALEQLSTDVHELRETIERQNDIISDKDHQIAKLQAITRDRRQAVEKVTAELQQLHDTVERLERLLSDKEQQINGFLVAVKMRDQTLWEIETSLAWNLVTRYRRMRQKFFPDGSRRGKYYHLLKKFVKVFIQEGPRNALRKTLKATLRSISLLFTNSSSGCLYETTAAYLDQASKPQHLLLPEDPYNVWLGVNAWSDKAETHLRKRLMRRADQLPLISVVMPLLKPDSNYVTRAVSSVKRQIYENWELCVAVDASGGKITSVTWDDSVAADSRIKVALLSNKSDMARAVNSAAELAEGEFVAFLNPADELAPDALAEFALYLAEQPETDFVYSDEDKIDKWGRRFDPQFKPGWSPELLLSYMYCGWSIVVRREIFQRIGGMKEGYEGAEHYDFVLRASEQARQVGHLPLVLYHRRCCPSEEAASAAQKPYGAASAQRAVQEAMERRGSRGVVFRPDWAVQKEVAVYWHEFPDDGPTVAIIILANDNHAAIRRCLASIGHTTYKNYQIVIVEEGSGAPTDIENILKVPHRVITFRKSANSAAVAGLLNRTVERLHTEFVLFLDVNAEIREPQWLSRMVGYAQLSGVGVVGTALYSPEGGEQYCANVNGLTPEMARLELNLSPKTESDLLTHAALTRNCSAVSRTCMLTSRRLFVEAGGFDEEHFGTARYDIDYCYRLNIKGYRCVSSAGTDVLYHECDDRCFILDPKVTTAFWERHGGRKDPWCNPNLTISDGRFTILPRKIVRSSVQAIRALMCSHNLAWEGAPQSQYELTVALKRLGVLDPIVFSPEDGPLSSMYRAQGIEVVVQKHPLLGVYTSREFNDAIVKFGDFCYDLNVEIIYANTLQTFYAITTAEQIGLPSLWNPRESEPWQYYFDFLPAEIKNNALECFRYPYRVIFVSEATRTAWQPLNLSHNFMVIHNGLDTKTFKSRCGNWTRESARRFLKIQEHEAVIMLLGTVCARKGQQDLPLALRKVPTDVAQQLRCYIVGDRVGEYSEELRRLVSDLPAPIRERVCIVPETHDVGLYYLAADIFLCSSRVESYPRVILEAMALGLPIVTTNVFGIKEQVVENFNALCYEPGNIERLAEALVRLVTNREERALFAANSVEQFRTLTTFEQMVNGYAEVFREAYLSKGYPKRRFCSQAGAR